MVSNVFDYILQEENAYNTVRIPLTGSKDWNMKEHIERCTNVANAWYHSGKNDGKRPYDDIVTPVINVAFRSEGFDAKDIVPFVDDVDKDHLSLIIKKYHPQWSRKHELDTFIDDLVETSIIYDLALVKNVNNILPEVVDLRTIAFCDQTDVLAGPLCIKHYYTPAQMMEFKGKWEDSKIDEAIVLAEASKDVKLANDQKAKTPGKYIEVYELRGNMPESWLVTGGDMYKFVPQMHLVCFYTAEDGSKNGITLYKGKDKPLTDNFKALKIDRIRSKGRACGRSIVETLFEPQVWNNYSAIKIKKLLDSAISIFQTESDEIGGQRISDIKDNTILKHEPGRPVTKVDGTLQNLTEFTNYQSKQENSARILGSASDAQLGTSPSAGTPFALQSLVVQQGQGIHEYRQGKIATFFADVLYRDWILQYMVNDLNKGKTFSEQLSFDELNEICKTISENQAEAKIREMILAGQEVSEDDRVRLRSIFNDEAKKKYGKRGFFEIIKGELDKIPLSVMVNIKGKQRNMAENADKITNILREIIANPQVFTQVPGIAKAFNQLLEESGLNAIDYTPVVSPVQPQQTQLPQTPQVTNNKQ